MSSLSVAPVVEDIRADEVDERVGLEGDHWDHDNDPFSHLVSTNDQPTDAERDVVVQRIAEFDGELAALDTQIAELEETLKRLKEQRSLNFEKTQAYRRILSPSRKLAPELVAAILRAALFSGAEQFSYPPISEHLQNQNIFRNLRSVCRLWRDVAFATKDLWACVWIEYAATCATPAAGSPPPQTNVQDLLPGIKSYLSRSGTVLPQSIGVRCLQERLFVPQFDDFLDFVVASKRWKRLSITTTSAWFWALQDKSERAYWDGASPYTNVETFRLAVAASTPAAPPDMGLGTSPYYLDTLRFPRLRSFSFLSSRKDPSTTTIWITNAVLAGHAHLQALLLSLEVPLFSYLFKLTNFPSLLFLRIDGLSSNPGDHAILQADITPLPEQMVTLPKLTALSVVNIASSTLFAHLTLPALRYLVVGFCGSSNVLPHALEFSTSASFDNLSRFLTRSKCSIIAGGFGCRFMDDGQLLALFKLLPRIHTLVLDSWFLSDPGPDLDGVYDGILPELRTLSISDLPRGADGRPLDAAWRSMFAFIKARVSGSRPPPWFDFIFPINTLFRKKGDLDDSPETALQLATVMAELQILREELAANTRISVQFRTK